MQLSHEFAFEEVFPHYLLPLDEIGLEQPNQLEPGISDFINNDLGIANYFGIAYDVTQDNLGGIRLSHIIDKITGWNFDKANLIEKLEIDR